MNIVDANKLKDEANKLLKNGEVEKSIEIYSKAISNIPKLPNDLLAVFYSNRSAAYLRAANDDLKPSANWGQLAITDATKAVNLRPCWFKGHYRVGCSYVAINKFKEALPHFDKAVGLEPGNLELRTARDDCRQRISRVEVNGRYKVIPVPYSEEDYLKQFNASRGIQITEKHLEKIKENFRKDQNSIADVLDGDSYRKGIGVKQDYKKAVELYTKAANKGNPEGIFNLAILVKKGHGVKQDFQRAIELFKKAAEIPPFLEGGSPNIGVADSELQIGFMYMEGVGVQPHPPSAAGWFQRSSDHGCALASHNLANLYMHGEGVEKSVERAVQYWKLAASRNFYHSMRFLADHYLHVERDIEEAKKWNKRAIERGLKGDEDLAAEFERNLRRIENDDEDISKRVKDWEAENSLPVKNLKFKERMVRMLEGIDPAQAHRLSKTHYDLTTVLESHNSARTPANISYTCEFDPKINLDYVKKGSQTALRLSIAYDHFLMALTLMELQTSGHKLFTLFVQELANCFLNEVTAGRWTEELKLKAVAIVDKLLTSDNLPPEVEKNARVCYTCLHLSSFQEILVFLKESINKFPAEVFFYVNYSNVLYFLEEYENAVQAANKALELFPGNADLLYNKIKGISEKDNHSLLDAEETCKKFLEAAAPDNKFVPDCYYMLAAQYLKHQRSQEEIIKYYKLGLEAEKIQLPFFLPYECACKFCLEAMIPSLARSEVSLDKGPSNTELSNTELIRLTDPRRVEIVTIFRKATVRMKTNIKDPIIAIGLPAFVQKAPSKTAGLKPITLRDFNSKNELHNGCVIKLVCIEDAVHQIWSDVLGLNNRIPSNVAVVEDKNGDVQRLIVNSSDDEIKRKLVFGCWFSIMNPYLEIAFDDKVTLRVDDINSLFFHTSERELKRCRFCGKCNAEKACGRCKNALYCSRDCQERDWKAMKHKLVCTKV